ncbi:aromatic amino acid transport family protein [Candidatus Protochlamydia amoebophila]|uniref:aromatic amino acid transport family protein n=1 Tax=Candidatus Protochlamydia amoebophila TaxID=362787 RepID=UPI001BCA4E64
MLTLCHQESLVILCCPVFAFFALATSFLGIALALFDFLSDGLEIFKKVKKRFI